MINRLIFIVLFSATMLFSGDSKCIKIDGISPYIDTNHALSKDDVLKYNLKSQICKDEHVLEYAKIFKILRKKHFKQIVGLSSIDYRMRLSLPTDSGLDEIWFATGLSSVAYEGKIFCVDKKGVRILRAYFKKTIADFLAPKLPEPE